MAHGSVIALDTPQKIKDKYGVGYHLIIEAQADGPDLDIQSLDEVVTQHEA